MTLASLGLCPDIARSIECNGKHLSLRTSAGRSTVSRCLHLFLQLVSHCASFWNAGQYPLIPAYRRLGAVAQTSDNDV
jgi:hypothetical protein